MEGTRPHDAPDDAHYPCPSCGQPIRSKALQCIHCRKWVRYAGSEPDPAPAASEPEKTEEYRYSRGQRPSHVVILWVLTLELYAFYWFYRNWRDLAEYSGDEVNPALRTLGLVVPFLNVYLIYELFRRISELSGPDEDSPAFDPITITAAFFGIHALGSVMRFSSVDLLASLALPVSMIAALVSIPVQVTLNRFWAGREPGWPVRDRFQWYELMLMAAGIVLTLAGLSAGA